MLTYSSHRVKEVELLGGPMDGAVFNLGVSPFRTGELYSFGDSTYLYRSRDCTVDGKLYLEVAGYKHEMVEKQTDLHWMLWVCHSGIYSDNDFQYDFSGIENWWMY